MNENRIDQQAERVEQLLREVHYQLIRVSRSELLNRRMTPPRFHALFYIVRHAPTDMGTMHTHMHLGRSSLTSLVDGLVDDGLIQRERSPDDRRRVVLTPTGAGIDLLEQLRRTRCAHLHGALQGLAHRNVNHLAEALQHVFDHLQGCSEKETT